jgi:hypothetical protein
MVRDPTFLCVSEEKLMATIKHVIDGPMEAEAKDDPPLLPPLVAAVPRSATPRRMGVAENLAGASVHLKASNAKIAFGPEADCGLKRLSDGVMEISGCGLQVGAGLSVGPDARDCAGSSAGLVRFDADAKALLVCNGDEYLEVRSGATTTFRVDALFYEEGTSAHQRDGGAPGNYFATYQRLVGTPHGAEILLTNSRTGKTGTAVVWTKAGNFAVDPGDPAGTTVRYAGRFSTPSAGDWAVGDWARVGAGTGTAGALAVPAGTEAERPAVGVPGQIRYNSDTGFFEGFMAGGSSDASPRWELLGWVPPLATLTGGLELHLDAKSFGNSGETWQDQSGGTQHNAARWGSAPWSASGGGSFSFDGGGFDIAGWSSFHAAPEFTFEVWAKHRSHRSTNTGILTQYDGGSGKANWMFQTDNGFHMNGMKGSSNSDNRPNYEHNVWYRFALVFRADHGYDFYVNNDLVYTQSETGNVAGSTGSFGIGARDDRVEPCDAAMAVVRVYTRALSVDELQYNFDLESGRFA